MVNESFFINNNGGNNKKQFINYSLNKTLSTEIENEKLTAKLQTALFTQQNHTHTTFTTFSQSVNQF